LSNTPTILLQFPTVLTAPSSMSPLNKVSRLTRCPAGSWPIRRSGGLINEGQRKMAEGAEVIHEYVIKELKEIVRRCTGGSVYNPKDATKALELLGKHIGMFKDDPLVVV
jgi:hypothetical protein